MIDMSTIYAGAALAASGAVVYSLKSLPATLYKRVKRNLIYTVKIYQYDELFDVLESYLFSHHSSKYRSVEATIKEISENTQPALFAPPKSDGEESLSVRYKQEETTFIIKYSGKSLIIEKDKEKIDKAQNLKDIYFRKYTLSGFRAKKQIDEFLNEAINFSRSKKEENIVKVRTNTAYGDWFSPRTIKVKPLDKTIINQEVKLALLNELDEFSSMEKWYLDTGIPYKRGLCFYGPPGTGKTTLALAIANYTKRKVYCLNLNCIENDSKLPIIFSDMDENAILLIEDIDKVFAGRENVNEKCGVTFSALLNCMDGAFYKHGLITIITTNHIEKLDEALLRTGRIDTKLEVPLPSQKEIEEYLSIFYNLPNFVVAGKYIGNFKMSDIQEICLQNKNDVTKVLTKIFKNEEATGMDIHI